MSELSLEEKLDKVLKNQERQQPILDALGDLLIEADYVTKAKGLNKSTISQNEKLDKFQEIGKRKILLTVESVAVVKARKRGKK